MANRDKLLKSIDELMNKSVINTKILVPNISSLLREANIPRSISSINTNILDLMRKVGSRFSSQAKGLSLGGFPNILDDIRFGSRSAIGNMLRLNKIGRDVKTANRIKRFGNSNNFIGMSTATATNLYSGDNIGGEVWNN